MGLFDLEVAFQGPGIPRLPIPDSLLYQAQDAASTTNWANGLNYACYIGSWDKLPNFQGLSPTNTGITSNFNLAKRSQDTEVGMRFSGFVEIPRDGFFTFWLRSDDGSRLFIDHSSLRLNFEDSVQLPIPKRLFTGQPLPETQDCIWSVIDGRVTFITERPGFLDLELNSGTGVIDVRVANASGEYSPLLIGSNIRVTGVLQSSYTTDGKIIGGTLLVPGLKQVEILEPTHSLWSATPISSIAALTRPGNPDLSEGIARIFGRADLTTSDGSALVADNSGRIQVENSQSFPTNTGVQVEVIGHRQRIGTNTILDFAFCRIEPGTKNESPVALPLLTTIAQVKSLTEEKAQKGYPVKIRGIVTAPFSTGFFIQDGTWAIYVRSSGLSLLGSPRSGDYWEVDGTTYAEFSPNIQASKLVRLGPGMMPAPIRPTLDQLANGSLDTLYIEIDGVVTDTGSDYLGMLTPEGRIQVRVSDIDPAFSAQTSGDLNRYENASIRLRGCAIPGRDEATQQILLGKLWVWLCNYAITVVKPTPRDPFSIPTKTVADLRKFNPYASILERVKVSGQIIHHQGRDFFLWDGTNGLRFISKDVAPLQLGDLVDVVGFPDFGGTSLVLREAIARRTGHASLPKPYPLPNVRLVDHNYEGRLVQIQANLIDISTESSTKILTLQAGAHGFVARLNGRQEIPAEILPGSRVSLSGVYASMGSLTASQNDATSFELLLNGPADITLLAHPDWWTLRRVLAAFGVISIVLVGAFLWIITLRRQVSSQAQMLRHKIESEATLEERARIARDIHDTLEQALAGTSLQLKALADPIHSVPQEPLRILKVAQAMISHAQTEVRRTVRNLRLLDVGKHNLPMALSQFVTTAGVDNRIRINVKVNGLYRSQPSQVENHLLRIGQEAVTNAIKHSGAKNINIELNYETSRLRLSIQDDGCGFDTTGTNGMSSGKFGLLGMRERAEKIGGTLQVASHIGQGTTISVTLIFTETSAQRHGLSSHFNRRKTS
jgi:signal transduction histidine kinase